MPLLVPAITAGIESDLPTLLKAKKGNFIFCQKIGRLSMLVDLVSQFPCNTRGIVDASSDPPVSNVKLL